MEKYKMDSSKTGILQQPLNAFAESNRRRDCKLSLDGKKIVVGFKDKMGDEDLAGYEAQPTLSERRTRLNEELSKLNSITEELRDIKEISNPTDLSDEEKAGLHTSLTSVIGLLSKRIKELRDMEVKTKLSIEGLMKKVETPSWMKSKVANAISFFKGRSIKTAHLVKQLLKAVDELGFFVSVINGTHLNYVRGSNAVVNLNQLSNYVCLKEMTSRCLQGLDLADNSTIIKQRTQIMIYTGILHFNS